MLDGLHLGAGFVGGVALVLVLILVLAAVVTRLMGVAFPGAAGCAGYAMAASSFLALAHGFRHGPHIRVTVVLQRFPAATRRPAELLCLTVAAGLAWYFGWFAVKLMRISHLFGDISQGQDATPLWNPSSSRRPARSF